MTAETPQYPFQAIRAAKRAGFLGFKVGLQIPGEGSQKLHLESDRSADRVSIALDPETLSVTVASRPGNRDKFVAIGITGEGRDGQLHFGLLEENRDLFETQARFSVSLEYWTTTEFGLHIPLPANPWDFNRIGGPAVRRALERFHSTSGRMP